ncbi:MAG: hypothetical protein AAFV53_02910 [Myxococcota bacterium]
MISPLVLWFACQPPPPPDPPDPPVRPEDPDPPELARLDLTVDGGRLQMNGHRSCPPREGNDVFRFEDLDVLCFHHESLDLPWLTETLKNSDADAQIVLSTGPMPKPWPLVYLGAEAIVYLSDRFHRTHRDGAPILSLGPPLHHMTILRYQKGRTEFRSFDDDGIERDRIRTQDVLGVNRLLTLLPRSEGAEHRFVLPKEAHHPERFAMQLRADREATVTLNQTPILGPDSTPLAVFDGFRLYNADVGSLREGENHLRIDSANPNPAISMDLHIGMSILNNIRVEVGEPTPGWVEHRYQPKTPWVDGERGRHRRIWFSVTEPLDADVLAVEVSGPAHIWLNGAPVFQSAEAGGGAGLVEPGWLVLGENLLVVATEADSRVDLFAL